MTPTSSTWRRAAVGGAVGIAWIAGLLVAEPLIGGFGLVPVAEAIIVSSPGWLSTAAISLLGFYAQPALVAGVVTAVLAMTTLVAVAWPRAPGVLPPVSVALGLVATTALLIGAGARISGGLAAGVLVAVAPPYLVARALATPASETDRRPFLRRVGGVAIAGTGATLGTRYLLDRIIGTRESERVEAPLEGSVSPPTGEPAFDFDGMPAAVTSPDDHYVIDINVRAPRIDPEMWTLDVDGVVGEPYLLSYDELLEHPESIEQTTTMLCISNQVGGDLIGTAHWTGVQLSDLVAAAEPREGAVDVVTHAADGYSEAIPIELVEREDILIAFGMGERTLAAEHGFPARLLIPGRYGMKMTKWITRIEIVDREHEAYWEERGWDEEAIVNTMAYVRGAERTGTRVTVGGVVFGGLETGVEEIDAVEVSVDGGDTWQEGDLEARLDVHAWRRWRYEFEAPDQSEFEVVVRAVESDGSVQTAEETSPRPGGATGWHRMTVEI